MAAYKVGGIHAVWWLEVATVNSYLIGQLAFNSALIIVPIAMVGVIL